MMNVGCGPLFTGSSVFLEMKPSNSKFEKILELNIRQNSKAVKRCRVFPLALYVTDNVLQEPSQRSRSDDY